MNILFHAIEYDYEEGRETVIFEKDGKYYSRFTGYKVFVGDYDYTEEVTSDEALKIMMEQIEYEDVDYLGYDYPYLNGNSKCQD